MKTRTDTVKNRNLLVENSEIEIFITSIRKISDQANLGEAQKCRLFKN